MRTTIRIAAAAAAVLAVAAVFARRTDERRRPPRRPPPTREVRVLPPDSDIAGRVDEEHTVGAWKLMILADTILDERVFDLQLNGRRVRAVRAATLRLEFVGQDITGDRIPDVVIQAFTGGMHCCSQALVLGLGDSLVDHGTIDGADGDIEFTDSDGDGRPEVKVGDWRFAYWRDYPFVETVVPEVVLKFRDGAWRPACDLMREEAPTERVLRQRAQDRSAGWVAGDPPPDLWEYAVDLVYAGHADLAWRFLDLAWPRRIPGREAFVTDLKERLRGSPCWSVGPAERPSA